MDYKINFSDISLRSFNPSDADDFMVWAGDDKVTKFCSYESFKNKEDAINYINTSITGHPWFRAICLNNRAIGNILVTPNGSDGDKCRAELGYTLAYEYWGKGIGTEAVKLAVKDIFKDWPSLERLEALVEVENVGSQKVLEKVGFQKEGLLRKYYIIKGKTYDFFMFSLLSTDSVN